MLFLFYLKTLEVLTSFYWWHIVSEVTTWRLLHYHRMFSGYLETWKYSWVNPCKFLSSLIKLLENENKYAIYIAKGTITLPCIQPNSGISWLSESKSVGAVLLVPVETCQQTCPQCFTLQLRYYKEEKWRNAFTQNSV